MKYLAIFALFFLPVLAEAATLSFSAPSTPPVDTEFPIYIYVDSEEIGFNAVEAVISFPTDKLEVVSIDSTAAATILNFWLNLPAFSNEDGTITFSGGTTKGTTGLDVPILKVTMRAVGIGDAIITASDASINASDGRGTNILDKVQALRLTVIPNINIPPKPIPAVTPTPKPDVVEPDSEEVEVVPEVAISDTTSVHEISSCIDLFVDCNLPYPVIREAVVETNKQAGANIFVSGTADEGTHVHILLTRNDVIYKEITAVVETDKTWKGILSNIHAYGAYTISAWSDDEERQRGSTTVTWDPIELYPPFTFHPFNIILRWYMIVPIVAGLLLGLSLISLLWRHFIKRKPYKKMPVLLWATALTSIGLVATTVMTYMLWQKEYRPEALYWKDTDIKCVLREHSWIDSYESVQLSIVVDGVSQKIPTGVGFSPECVASLHTHDDTGRLHIQPKLPPHTILDFFVVTGIPFEQEGYLLTGVINGNTVSGGVLHRHELRDNDVIELRYTKITDVE